MSTPNHCVWDIETSIRTSYKRKANPFDPENGVVMSGWVGPDGIIGHDYFGRADLPGGEGLPKDWFIKLLVGHKLLVGQNIKFDLLYALRDPHNLKAWMAWVADGGNVWDTQLAEYLLEGMTSDNHMLSLDELAPRYGGNIKFDEVKALWAAGVSTEDIPVDLLTQYLIGTDADQGDIGNTQTVFLGQLARARAAGQVKSILLNMGSLLYSIEAERNGMAVDVVEGKRQALEIEAEIAVLDGQLQEYLPKDLPFEFKWGSAGHKSALIFGGTVTYQERVHLSGDDGQPLYTMKDERRPILDSDGNHTTFKTGKNAGEPKTQVVKVPDLEKPKMRWEDREYVFPGFTQPSPRWATARPGVYSVAADVIADLGSRDIPFLKTLSTLAGRSKDLTTYYITDDPKTGGQKGMLTLVQPDGIIHHSLNHTSTVTGRFSSSNPNLQNLPKGQKSGVKGLFVSRFAGGSIIQSDFTALEVYVQAILTNDAQLIDDLRAGLDMHCVRVSQKEGIEYDLALLRCKGDKANGIDAIPEWDYKRTKAKVFSFQRAYGAGAATIAASTGMDQQEVEALIAAEESRYPQINPYFAKITEQLNNTAAPWRTVQHPDFPGLTVSLSTATFRTPDNKLYTWRQSPAPDYLVRKGVFASFSPTEIKNYPVQGAGGEWAKAAMWLAIRYFYASDNLGGDALLVNQVHDANYADAAPHVRDLAAAMLHASMTEASTFMEWWFGWHIPCPVPSETTAGPSMLDEGKLPSTVTDAIPHHQATIRRLYMNNFVPSWETQQYKEAA